MLNFHPTQYDDAHVSIIDTKLLPGRNVVLYTPRMHIIAAHIPGQCRWEYLAFGKIEAPRTAAVSMRKLLNNGIRLLNAGVTAGRSSRAGSLSLSSEIKIARNVANAFGKGFELPAILYLLSLRDRSPIEIKHIVSCLSKDLVVPQEWCEDSTILAPESTFFGGYGDTECANKLLQAILNKQHGKGATRGAKAKALERVKAELNDAKRKKAGDSAAKLKTVAELEKSRKRMLDELYIGLNGWESHLPNKMRATRSNRVGSRARSA